MDGRREQACPPVPAPPGFAAATYGYAWARDTIGESGAAVYRLHAKTDAPDLFLKHGAGTADYDAAADVVDEMVRLRWLGRHIAVPEVVQFHASPGDAWLLTTALPGRTAYQAMAADPACRPAVVDALAAFLRRLHAIPVRDCPFTSDHLHRLARARMRIDAGRVDEDDFDDVREGWTADQVWQAMQDLLPLAPDPVVTHGDFSLDNLFIQGGDVAGCIDVGRAGIADRYQDIAIAWNCLGEFGAPLQARFLTQYGMPEPDRDKLAFHLLLDELF